MQQIDLKNCTITILDGSSNSVAVNIGSGSIKWTESRNIEYVLDKGLLATAAVRKGDEVPVEVDLEFVWDFIESSGGLNVSPYEALTQTGGAAAWVSTGGACEPYACKLKIVNDYNCGTSDVETIILDKFRYEKISPDARSGMISVSGKCQITRGTYTRASS